MRNIVFQFFLQLIIGVLIIFGIHLFLLKINKFHFFDNKIISAYILNVFLAIIIFLFLYFFRKKYKDQLGFLYMLGSFLKFMVFFIFFYPAYKLDGNLTRLEFFAFFVPYLTCLLIETLSLIKLLNSSEQNQ